MSSVIEKLSEIQRGLSAPKNQTNAFGKYKYRSCEDILEAVKKHLNDGEAVVLSDEIIAVGDRVYVKATAQLLVGDNLIANTAFARESLTKKGMDDSQITGTASSYARKYALNGLFLIDDNKDADTMDNSLESQIEGARSIDQLMTLFGTLNQADQKKYKDAFGRRKTQMEIK